MNHICVGGPHSGRRVSATGQPEYRFTKMMPLSAYTTEDGTTVRTYEDRYIRQDAYFDGLRHIVYVYEHDTHRDLIELLTNELAQLKAQL